jgi:hypothetical protein
MLQRFVVIAAAWLEIVAGLFFLAVPDLPWMPLFAAKPEGVGVHLARLVGLGLLALGIACLPSTTTGSRRGVLVCVDACVAG